MNLLKYKNYLIFFLLLAAFIFIVITKNILLLSIVLFIVITLSLGMALYTAIRWTGNKKLIGNNYIKANMENVMFEIFLIFITYIDFKTRYFTRVMNLNLSENQSIEITNFKSFLESYTPLQRSLLYLMILLAVVAFVRIIKSYFCRCLISPTGILLYNGELIDFNSVKDIKVENNPWSFSNKITIVLEKEERIFNMSQRGYSKIEDILGLYNFNSCKIDVKDLEIKEEDKIQPEDMDVNIHSTDDDNDNVPKIHNDVENFDSKDINS